jgi:PmbA protein
MIMQLEPIMKKALKTALSEGVNDAEVFAVRSRTLSVYVDDNAIKNVEEKADQGLSVRVIRAKKIGQASSTYSNIRDAEGCAVKAVKLAGVSQPDPVFKNFPLSEKGAEVPNVYDRAVSGMDADTITGLAKSIVSSAVEAGNIKVPSGLIRVAAIQSMLANTNGVETENRNTMIYAHFTSMTEGENPGEGIRSFSSPNLSGFDTAEFGKQLGQGAIDSMKAVPFEGEKLTTVIIPPSELQELLSSTVSYSISAENVLRHRSAWGEMLGKEVASPNITIVDDPFDTKGMLSSGYDDEGVRTSRKVLIDRGVLKTFLYDSYNAQKAGVRPTGNGMRRSSIDSQNLYRNGIDIDPVNLVVKPGTKSLEQVIAGIDDGLMIGRLASADASGITGAFGLEIRCAYLIKKGTITGTVNHALLAGNVYEGLKNVMEVANDTTVVRSGILPSVAFDGMEIIGSK